MKKISLSYWQLILGSAAVFCAFFNFTFYTQVLAVYPISENFLFLGSISVVLMLATTLLLSILIWRKIYKISLFLFFFIASLAAYVMDSYGIVIDENMLLNILKTDVNESLDLVTPKLFIYLFGLFIIPVFVLSLVKIKELTWKGELKQKGIMILTCLIFTLLTIFGFGKNYATFFREHKPLRYYTNPSYWIYSTVKFGTSFLKSNEVIFNRFGTKSLISPHDKDRELIIIVVGETARRDRFSLNGYSKKTNPLLEKEADLVSFSNVTACGTSTAVSVPCMFSHYGRDEFSTDKAKSHENLLDVLIHTKDINVLWRDNNSDSKGVALRVAFEDYKTRATNTICDTECRDEGMLVGLQEHIDKVKEKDVVIVLHQMGNHGPAYYKRYPEKFEVFRPVCKTSELSKCSQEEIDNAYDNVILYTDYFLSKTIELLKKNSAKFNTAMLYVSDHGESLGENGIYLHSMPYMMAPKEQIEVPMLMWFGGEMKRETDYVKLHSILEKPFSHDNLFHTVLGMMEVEFDAYNPDLDILHGIHFQTIHPISKHNK